MTSNTDIDTWVDWPQTAPGPTVDPHPDAAILEAHERLARANEIESRRSRARTVDQGGPWIEVFETSDTSDTTEEQPHHIGPLAMDTFAIKSLVAVEGRVTTAGSQARSDAAPETTTAPIVHELERAGATALGIVTMHEFAFGVTGVNNWQGTAPNPASPDRVPGGSSSGSASAVADGSASFAIGTDTGGSVRIPSAFCGIAGFKPAFGTYPRQGVFPLSNTLDHVGMHAPRVQDLCRIHAALCPQESPATELADLRIGVARTEIQAAQSEVRTAIESALEVLEAAGVELVDVDLPSNDDITRASTLIICAEAAQVHATAIDGGLSRYGDDVGARLEFGATISPENLEAAMSLRDELTSHVKQTLSDVTAIAFPTVPILAPLLNEARPELLARIIENSRLANVVGLPALTLPVPTSGPAVGLQLLGAENSSTLTAALTVERVLAPEFD